MTGERALAARAGEVRDSIVVGRARRGGPRHCRGRRGAERAGAALLRRGQPGRLRVLLRVPLPTDADADARVRRGQGGVSSGATRDMFLLVAEAGLGTSRRQPGSEGVFNGRIVDPITHASGRPSLQVLSDHDLGNGTLDVDCRTLPLGGVKGFPGRLHFPAGRRRDDRPASTWRVASSCTSSVHQRLHAQSHRRLRLPRHRHDAASSASRFPQVAAVSARRHRRSALQFRDTSGNLGPRQEIVIRVDPSGRQPAADARRRPRARRQRRPAPASPAASATTAPIARCRTRSCSSTTAHCATRRPTAPATTPSPICRPATPSSSRARRATSACRRRSPRSTRRGCCRAWPGTRPFDANQRLAADVTGDGTVSALDATRILQRQVGLLPRFVVADRCNSDWVFRPMPGPALNQRLIQPLISTGVCRTRRHRARAAGRRCRRSRTSSASCSATRPGTGSRRRAGAALRGAGRRPAHACACAAPGRPAGGMLRLPLAIKGDRAVLLARRDDHLRQRAADAVLGAQAARRRRARSRCST